MTSYLNKLHIKQHYWRLNTLFSYPKHANLSDSQPQIGAYLYPQALTAPSETCLAVVQEYTELVCMWEGLEWAWILLTKAVLQIYAFPSRIMRKEDIELHTYMCLHNDFLPSFPLYLIINHPLNTWSCMYGPAISAGAAACSSADTLQLETGFYPRENTALGDKK